MLINNARFIVKSLITQSQAEDTTFFISEDFETGEHIETNGRTVSVVLQNSTNLERFLLKMSGGQATIVKRGIGKGSEITSNKDLQKLWSPSTLGYITTFASDLLDIDDSLNTTEIKSSVAFKGKVDFTSFDLPKFNSEAERDLAYPEPKIGSKCFLLGIGEQVYNGGMWNTLGIGTPTPDATEELAGKVQIASKNDMLTGNDKTDSGVAIVPKMSQVGLKFIGSQSFIFFEDYTTFMDIPELANFCVVSLIQQSPETSFVKQFLVFKEGLTSQSSFYKINDIESKTFLIKWRKDINKLEIGFFIKYEYRYASADVYFYRI